MENEIKEVKLRLDDKTVERIDKLVKVTNESGLIDGTTRNKFFKYLVDCYHDHIIDHYYYMLKGKGLHLDVSDEDVRLFNENVANAALAQLIPRANKEEYFIKWINKSEKALQEVNAKRKERMDNQQ